MAQPAFWLKVNKDYVIENFEGLIVYLRNYDYKPSQTDENVDFDDSCRCLSEVAGDLSQKIKEFHMWESPEFDSMTPEKAVRILAASVLTNRKRGVQDHEGILSLIRLLLLVHKSMKTDTRKRLLDLALACICRRDITRLSFSFNSIYLNEFSVAPFSALLAATVCAPVNENARFAFEGKGSLIIKEGRFILTPMNLAEASKTRLRNELHYDSVISLDDNDPARLDTETELIEFYPRLYSLLQAITPSPTLKPNEYHDGNRLQAVITNIYDNKVTVKTVDNKYAEIRGRLHLDAEILRFPRESLTRLLHVGDYINVIYNENVSCPFILDYEVLNDFAADYAREVQGETVQAIFFEEFKSGKGTRWLSEDGFFINVIGAYDSMPAQALEAAGNDLPLMIKIDYVTTDNNGNSVVNGSFNLDAVIPISEDFSGDEFSDNAIDKLINYYISYMQPAESEKKSDEVSPITFPRIEGRDLDLIGRLLSGIAPDMEHTRDHMATLVIAMAATEISGDIDDTDYIRHCLDYLAQLIRFAQGASPMSLTLNRPPLLLDEKSATVRDRVIEALKNYHETGMTQVAKSPKTSILGDDEETLPDTVAQLVRASNILADKIDSSEINRIKKSIAQKLGVDDVYRNLNRDLPYFGVESETLEFKRSCCFTPAGKRSGSQVNDIDTQLWNILRTICGFLNSQLGGELLIGVTDTGYACGLMPDIDCLYSAGMISERNADRLRTYLKYEIDKVFETLDGSAKGIAITSEFVHCNIESPDGHMEILRIKIEPYPWDVVKLIDEGRPEYIAPVYRRTSGATTPMDKDGIRNIKLAKIKALDRGDIKIAQIMQAIDKGRMVKLHGYSSRKGKADHKIEPHRIFHDHNAVQAFDIESRMMKLYKLARVDSVEILPEKWKNQSQHKDYAVDIFGMMEDPVLGTEKVKLRMSDYALSLLSEEFPVRAGAGFSATQDKTSSRKLNWIVEIETYHPVGIARFILGLPNEIEVLFGSRLNDYLTSIRL